MNSGEKIAALRKSKGMTQAEIGTELNVTFQAVSKWERGESYPDFDTMSKLAKLFGVPLSYFEDGNDEKNETSATAAVAPDRQVMLGVCKECGKTVFEGEEDTVEPVLVCKKCAERKRQELKCAEEEENRKKQIEEQRRIDEAHKIRNRGLIWSGIIIGTILICCMIGLVNNSKYIVYILIGMAVALVFGYPFVAQLFWEGVISDIALFGGKIVGMPGVIFDLSLDGVMFLIAVKVLFAVIRFLIWLATFIAAASVAMVISPFTFPFALKKLNRGEEL